MTEKEYVEKKIQAGVFKIELEDISRSALEIAGLKTDYTDEQLADSLLPFMEVFTNKMHDFHATKLTDKQMQKLAMEAGKSIRQTVLLFTGIDTHKIYRKNDK